MFFRMFLGVLCSLTSVVCFAQLNNNKEVSPQLSKDIVKENPYAITITHGPYLHAVTDTSATVIWVTDKPAVSWVEIAPNDGSHFYAQDRQKFYQSPLGRKVIGTVHSVKVDGLKPATTYNYRVFSRRVVSDDMRTYYGAVASTKVYKREPLKLRTLDSSKTDITFSVVNDIHEKDAVLSEMLKFVPKNADFLLLNGDMVSHMESEAQLFKGFLDTVSKYTSKTGVPMFMVRGNHESRGLFSHEFMRYFPTSTNFPFYTFRVGPAYFVVIDGGEDKPDNDIEYSDRADFDNYRQKQAQWLKNIVASKEFKEAPVKIMLAHIPIAWGGWHGSKHFQKCFADIINNAGFSTIISAHLHRYEFLGSGDVVKVPNIINSNEEIMNVSVNADKITFAFITKDGKKAREDVVVDVVK